MEDENELFVNTEHINIKDCLNINFMTLTICGQWIPSSLHGNVKRIFYKIYSLFCVTFLVVSPIIFQVINAVLVFGDVEKFVQSMFFTVAQIAYVSKVYVCIRYHESVQKLFDTLEEPLFSTVDFISSATMRSTMRVHVIITVVFIVISEIDITCFALFPFLSSKGKTLPLPAWFPFDISKTNTFISVYVYQMICLYYGATTNVCYDTLIAGTISLACAQLDLLCDKLADKHRRRGLVPASDGQLVKDKRVSTIIFESETKKHLFNCIEHHVKIARFVKDTEDSFGMIAFMQIFASCIIVCFTAFQLTVVTSIIEAFGIMLYMVCMLIEFFIICYFGNELIIKNNRVSLAAYESFWHDNSLENKKYIFILMERVKRPLQVKAAIFTLSLDSFVSVMRSSYSYYAILRQVNSN